MSKNKYIAGTIGLGLVAVLVVAFFVIPRRGITKVNFDRVRDGMSLQEVERVFGSNALPSPFIWNGTGGRHVESWVNHDGSYADIHFEGDSVVFKVWTHSPYPRHEQILRRIFRVPPASQAHFGTSRPSDFGPPPGPIIAR